MDETKPMLLQLHWENPASHETIFVAQTEFGGCDVFWSWLNELYDRRGVEMPEGWVPLACTEDAPMFVKSLQHTTPQQGE